MDFLRDNSLTRMINENPVLVSTKNQASYERRVEQRKKDLADQQCFNLF